MWDKAVFAWVLFGLAVAAVALFPRDIRKHLSGANIAVAGLAMLAGALPLVIYNIARPLETLRSNAHLEPDRSCWHKTDILEQTMDGHVLFGFLTAVEPGPQPGQPKHWYQSLSLAASRWTGHPQRNAMLVAAIAAVLALAFLWKSPARQPILFGVIVCVGHLAADGADRGRRRRRAARDPAVAISPDSGRGRAGPDPVAAGRRAGDRAAVRDRI